MIPHFDRPYLLILAVLLPMVVASVLVLGYRRRATRLARLASTEMMSRLVPANALARPRWRLARLGMMAVLGAIALASPRWGSERNVVRSEGVDIVLALDASLSMLARDERPSRLERMKAEVQRLRAMPGGDRIGLLAFAGRSYILTPLTVDESALNLYLDHLEPSVVGQPGTVLSRTIRQGVALLQATTSESDQALLIMTDGEAHEPIDEIVEAARLARKAGIAVVVVGFGTAAGTTIPVSQAGGSTTLHRDESGEIVVTRYRPGVLRALADAAGGTFIDAGETDKAGRIRAALSTLRAVRRASVAASTRTPRFQLFVLPALALLFLDTLLTERRGRRRQLAAAATVATSKAA